MSGLQLTKDEKDALKFLMNASVLNPTYELEGIISSKMTAEQFKKVIARLSGNFKEKREVERLDITFPRDSKYSSTRISIVGFHDINKFCRTEKLDGIRNLVIEEKKPAKERVNKLTISEYDMRFNLKQELKLNRDLQHIKELFLPSKWREIPKVFRYKKIYQFVSEDGFSIDCSIVRSSQLNNQKMTVNEILKHGLVRQVIKPDDVSEPFGKWWAKLKNNKQAEVMVKNAYTFFKSVKESKVFENIMKYELEVEYIGNTEEEKKAFNSLKDKQPYIRQKLLALFKYIGTLLQCIQGSYYLTTQSEQQTLKTEYLKMLKSDNPALFIGALPVDLQHINCIETPDNLFDKITEPNIILDYAVCQKIDGERSLMYVDKQGECYLITRANENSMRKMGMNLGQKYANSLFDGEYLEYDMDGDVLNKLVLFDCYVISGKVMIDTVFGDDKSGEGSRYYHLRMLEAYYSGDNNDIRVMNGLSKYGFKLGFIQYLFGEKSARKQKNHQLIFQHSATLLNKMNKRYGGTLEEGHLFSYPTDGLIFIPTTRPLYNFQICDASGNNRAMICNRKVASYFKWKPIDKLTIDFRIHFVKSSRKERVVHYENGAKYAEVVLKCRNYDSFVYNKSGKQSVASNISSYLVNENRNLYKEAEEVNFVAVQPFQGMRTVSGSIHNTLYTAYLKINDDGNVCCLNGDIIYDGDVVEMAYDLSTTTTFNATSISKATKEMLFKRWIPERVRAGKVPNALNTAVDIWKLIHYNLSKENIMNGLTMSDMSEISNSYNLQLSKKTALQSFIDHGKKYLLDKFLTGMTQPRIADFGCNNMDYFLKLAVHNPSLILGLDTNTDVLNNKKTGAGSLLLKFANMSPKIRKVLERTMLIDADLTKSLSTGEAGEHSVLSTYYLDILYGRYKPDLTENAKLTTLYNQAGSGFNVITAFNILEEISPLDNSLEVFLENVANNLREQGYFIALMLDGEKIEGLFDTTNKLNILSGENMTWLIEKSEAESAELNVYYNYYNTLRRNYIIRPKNLIAMCVEHGLKLIDSKSLGEDLGELKSSFKGDYSELEKDVEAKGWISMQRYFVFQKSGSELNRPLTETNTIVETPVEANAESPVKPSVETPEN
jgi:hypothetical protein